MIWCRLAFPQQGQSGLSTITLRPLASELPRDRLTGICIRGDLINKALHLRITTTLITTTVITTDDHIYSGLSRYWQSLLTILTLLIKISFSVNKYLFIHLSHSKQLKRGHALKNILKYQEWRSVIPPHSPPLVLPVVLWLKQDPTQTLNKKHCSALNLPSPLIKMGHFFSSSSLSKSNVDHSTLIEAFSDIFCPI